MPTSTVQDSRRMIHADPTILSYLGSEHFHPATTSNDATSFEKGRKPLIYRDDSSSKNNNSISLCFRETLKEPVSNENLVALAKECDNFLYQDNAAKANPQEFLFSSSSLAMQSLIRLGEKNDNDDAASHAAAALLALNQLESAIRRRVSKTTGKAPLLKTMITVDLVQQQTDNNDDEYYNQNLSFLLQGLLLPTGLNLRNILWHGFCGGLPRPWLSLSIVMTAIIRKECLDNNEEQASRSSFKKKESSSSSLSSSMDERHLDDLRQLIKEYNNQLPRQDDPHILDWLPQSHHALWRIAYDWHSQHYSACSLALLSVLLEHGLRLSWCRVNERPEDVMAQPHRFYVTLDGHGQRHMHDILINPIRVDGQPNALITQQVLDGNLVALVSDLFCSASGPNNIRASLAHGLWDEYMERELTQMPSSLTFLSDDGTSLQQNGADNSNSNDHSEVFAVETKKSHDALQLHAKAVLLAIRACAIACQSQQGQEVLPKKSFLLYKPKYSYTATTRQSLVNLQRALMQDLGAAVNHKKDDDTTGITVSGDGLPEFLLKLVVPESTLDKSLAGMVHLLTCPDSSTNSRNGTGWTVEQVYQEHELNMKLAPMCATRTLAEDVAKATNQLNHEMNVARQCLDADDRDDVRLSTRQRKRYQRILALGRIGMVFYGFTAYVVLLSLQEVLLFDTRPRMEPKDRLKMVERSRMVVSTTITYLTTNTDRAFKAIEEFTKGKVIKQQVLPLLAELPE